MSTPLNKAILPGGGGTISQFDNHLRITEGLEKEEETGHAIVTMTLNSKPRAIRSSGLPRSTIGRGALK